MKTNIGIINKWSDIEWPYIELNVFKLQQRIYQAKKNDNFKQLRDLERTLLRSKSNLLLSIKKVLEIYESELSYKNITNTEKINLYEKLLEYNILIHKSKSYYFSYHVCNKNKVNRKLSSLEMNILIDRVYQQMIKNVLDPHIESILNPSIYGYRLNRTIHDSISKIFVTLANSNKEYFLKGRLIVEDNCKAKGFILDKLKDFVYTDLIDRWLSLADLDKERNNNLNPIFSLLYNILINGLENSLSITYKKESYKRKIHNNIIERFTYVNKSDYSVSQYEDEIVIFSKRNIKDSIINTLYLNQRSLKLVDIQSGNIKNHSSYFNFKDFSIRRFNSKISKNINHKQKVIITSSIQSLQSLKSNIKFLFKKYKGSKILLLITNLNRLLYKFSSYYKYVVSKKVFTDIDRFLYINTINLLKKIHPLKNMTWIIDNYFKPDNFNKSNNKWIFTDPISNKQLKKLSWIKIKRYPLITYDYSIYDKNLKDYFIERNKKLSFIH